MVAEKEIAKKMREIRKLLIDNDMFRSHYFTASIIGTCITFNNEYWDKDRKHPIKYVETEDTNNE